MFKKIIVFSSFLFASATLPNSVSAASIINGTFDSDLSGWSTVTTNGTAVWDSINNAAVLSTGADVAPYSAVLVQGDDGFFSFTNPILLGVGDDFLKFDAVFSSLGTDALETGAGPFTDNLQVWMYDANGLGDVLLATIDALTSNTGFSLNLASYIGHSVAFSFELNDEDDGLDSRVTLDNIRLEQRSAPPVTVPEPNTLLLMILGAFGIAGKVSRQKSK